MHLLTYLPTYLPTYLSVYLSHIYIYIYIYILIAASLANPTNIHQDQRTARCVARGFAGSAAQVRPTCKCTLGEHRETEPRGQYNPIGVLIHPHHHLRPALCLYCPYCEKPLNLCNKPWSLPILRDLDCCRRAISPFWQISGAE